MGLSKTILSRIEKIVGQAGVLTADTDLRAYSFDATSHWQSLPEVVVFPITTAHVSAVMRLANDNGIPVTVRGGRHLSQWRAHSHLRGDRPLHYPYESYRGY